MRSFNKLLEWNNSEYAVIKCLAGETLLGVLSTVFFESIRRSPTIVEHSERYKYEARQVSFASPSVGALNLPSPGRGPLCRAALRGAEVEGCPAQQTSERDDKAARGKMSPAQAYFMIDMGSK